MRAATDFIQQHQLLKKQSTILVAVSGGPDSIALLHFLCSLREELQLKIIALTVDHRLRGEDSVADADYVEACCKEWGVDVERTSVDVTVYKKERGIGTQVAARELRYRFFQEQMEKYDAATLALGHHGDDQVETMLMQFTRSADPFAVTGIPVRRPFSTGEIIRPFLAVRKQELIDYCESFGIQPRQDLSNDETAYTRNYFRKHVVPLLKRKNPNIHVTLQHLSERLQENERYLYKEAENHLQGLFSLDKNGNYASFQASEFNAYPIALQRQMYHLILNYLYKKLPDQLSYVHERQFFDLLNNMSSHRSIDFPQGLKIAKSYGMISLSFYKVETTGSYRFELNVPGAVTLPDGGRIEAVFSNQVSDDTYTFSICADTSRLPFIVRSRQEGDRMSWKGLLGSRKLKNLFIDEKIPKHEREQWPVITDVTGEILWLPGLRKSDVPTDGISNIIICLKYIKS